MHAYIITGWTKLQFILSEEIIRANCHSNEFLVKYLLCLWICLVNDMFGSRTFEKAALLSKAHFWCLHTEGLQNSIAFFFQSKEYKVPWESSNLQDSLVTISQWLHAASAIWVLRTNSFLRSFHDGRGSVVSFHKHQGFDAGTYVVRS